MRMIPPWLILFVFTWVYLDCLRPPNKTKLHGTSQLHILSQNNTMLHSWCRTTVPNFKALTARLPSLLQRMSRKLLDGISPPATAADERLNESDGALQLPFSKLHWKCTRSQNSFLQTYEQRGSKEDTMCTQRPCRSNHSVLARCWAVNKCDSFELRWCVLVNGFVEVEAYKKESRLRLSKLIKAAKVEKCMTTALFWGAQNPHEDFAECSPPVQSRKDFPRAFFFGPLHREYQRIWILQWAFKPNEPLAAGPVQEIAKSSCSFWRQRRETSVHKRLCQSRALHSVSQTEKAKEKLFLHGPVQNCLCVGAPWGKL